MTSKLTSLWSWTFWELQCRDLRNSFSVTMAIGQENVLGIGEIRWGAYNSYYDLWASSLVIPMSKWKMTNRKPYLLWCTVLELQKIMWKLSNKFRSLDFHRDTRTIQTWIIVFTMCHTVTSKFRNWQYCCYELAYSL